MAQKIETVAQFMDALKHPLKAEIEELRQLILSADKNITETIKWNAPNFCYKGNDRVTFKLYPEDSIQLIFHRGSKVTNVTELEFTDGTGLLTWITKDRALLTITDMQDLDAKKSVLQKLVRDWMTATE